jgi:hypothetical protein
MIDPSSAAASRNKLKETPPRSFALSSTGQQYVFSLTINQHQPPNTIQSAIFFFLTNKSASSTNHQW